MTSGHANVSYGSAHSSHSNAGHSNTGISHSNTGSVHANTGGSHTLSYGESTAELPDIACEGSLSTLYALSESIRTQYVYKKQRSTSLLPSLETTHIKLGSLSDTDSILYKLLANADNADVSEEEPSKISYTLNITRRQNYTNQGSHSNHSSHSSSTGTIDGTGDHNTGSKVIHSSSSPMGARTVNTSASYPNYITTFKSKAPSQYTDPGAVQNTLALKSQVDSLYGFLNSSKVVTNVVNRGAVTLSASSTDSGHSNTGHSSHGSHSNDYSMRKCKTDIHKFDGSAVKLINTLSIVSFKYKPEYGDPTITHYGFIADDTLEEFSTQYHDRMEKMNCIGLLLKAVQELSKKVSILEDKLYGDKK